MVLLLGPYDQTFGCSYWMLLRCYAHSAPIHSSSPVLPVCLLAHVQELVRVLQSLAGLGLRAAHVASDSSSNMGSATLQQHGLQPTTEQEPTTEQAAAQPAPSPAAAGAAPAVAAELHHSSSSPQHTQLMQQVSSSLMCHKALRCLHLEQVRAAAMTLSNARFVLCTGAGLCFTPMRPTNKHVYVVKHFQAAHALHNQNISEC
jgi:hypothetical protein